MPGLKPPEFLMGGPAEDDVDAAAARKEAKRRRRRQKEKEAARRAREEQDGDADPSRSRDRDRDRWRDRDRRSQHRESRESVDGGQREPYYPERCACESAGVSDWRLAVWLIGCLSECTWLAC